MMADDEEDRHDSEAMVSVPARGVLEQRAFDALETDIQQFLTELQEEKHLDRFRAEYEKLHRAVKKAHDSEKRLFKRCKELTNDIKKNEKKMTTAIKMNEEDQNTILTLRAEIDNCWIIVDDSQEKEAEVKEKIKLLKVEIAGLNSIIDSGVTETIAQDTQVADLEKEKAKVLREKDIQLNQLQELRRDQAEWNDKLHAAEQDKINLEHDLGLLRDQYNSRKMECDRENKKKDALEKEMKDLRFQMEARQSEVKAKQIQVAEGQAKVDKLDQMLKDQRQLTDRAQKELDLVLQKVDKVTADLDEQIKNNTTLMAENSQKHMELRLKDEEIEAQKQEIIKVNKTREATLNKLRSLEFVREDLEKEKNALIDDRIKIEGEIEVQKKQADQARKRMEESVRERDLLNKMKTQAEDATVKQQDLVKINYVAIHNLEAELQKYAYHATKQAKVITNLQEQSEEKAALVAANAAKYLKACEELRNQEIEIMHLQKQIMEWEAKIKQQQNLYETARTERTVNSRKVLESQNEIDEMKRKFKLMNQLVEQLKEEINSKDIALIKEHYDHQKVEREKEVLKGELAKAQAKIKHAETSIADHTAHIEHLQHIIEEADAEHLRQQKELEIIKSERTVLGAQLTKKNDELVVIYDKIRLQESTLAKGHVEYRKRLNELRLLKLKLNDLKREHTLLTGSCKNMAILKREVHNLSRELIQERTKVKALTEELENPLNVHRWRRLEGTDPQAYEMIIKIQTLQKKLTQKTEEVIEKDLLIQEKEKLYIELRRILARQPGPDVAEQMAAHGKALAEKIKQLKIMTSNLAMYQEEVAEHKKEIDLYSQELATVKKKYLNTKRQELAAQPKEPSLNPKSVHVTQPLPNRKVAGGFDATHHPTSQSPSPRPPTSPLE
ncbi:hypothetical protein BDL97_04G038800 [Sphagnum fallax]|nr:hypothetical protein BDL97_04G038800 [Sphagnum fallax]